MPIGTFDELSTYTSGDYHWRDLYAYFGVVFLKTTEDWLLIDMMIYSFSLGWHNPDQLIETADFTSKHFG
jgi:hypothetical protein